MEKDLPLVLLTEKMQGLGLNTVCSYLCKKNFLCRKCVMSLNTKFCLLCKEFCKGKSNFYNGWL